MASRCISSHDVDRLHAGEIQVWSIAIGDWLPFLGTLAGTLNAEEHDRAGRFRFERDRNRFVLCRGLLRTLLAEYLSREPADIEFRFGPQEKPRLADAASRRLEFNLSHSGEEALLAFALGRRVGVDIEHIRSGVDLHGLAQQVFTGAEIRRLSTAVEEEREDLFYTMWTQKEAYIKAVGLGLSAPVREIDVGQDVTGSGQQAVVGIIEGYGAQWSLLTLPAPDGYKAALAVEGRVRAGEVRGRPLRPAE